ATSTSWSRPLTFRVTFAMAPPFAQNLRQRVCQNRLAGLQAGNDPGDPPGGGGYPTAAALPPWLPARPARRGDRLQESREVLPGRGLQGQAVQTSIAQGRDEEMAGLEGIDRQGL